MDARKNPFRPGAGASPPELAGRDEIRGEVMLSLQRAKDGRPGKSALLVGLRGVGKTVLLHCIKKDAEAEGVALLVEVSEGKRLPGQLAPEFRRALEELGGGAARARRALSGFVQAWKIKYNGFSLRYAPEPGLADSGDLDSDLSALIAEAGKAAAAANTCIALFIDELQYAAPRELSALITAMHRAVQEDLPVMMVGAGLPDLRAKVRKAKTYTERMFHSHEIGRLAEQDAARALRKPARDNDADFTDEALAEIFQKARGYPYFLQEWGSHAWNIAGARLININDVRKASASALESLDADFFSIRMEGITPAEEKYLRAMAKTGKETMRSGEIARALKKRVAEAAPVRDKLIKKGMIWSPNRGDVEFTVPLFGEYLLRAGRGS